MTEASGVLFIVLKCKRSKGTLTLTVCSMCLLRLLGFDCIRFFEKYHLVIGVTITRKWQPIIDASDFRWCHAHVIIAAGCLASVAPTELLGRKRNRIDHPVS